MKDYVNRKIGNINQIRRLGIMSMLGVGMMLSLVACGTGPTTQPVTTAVSTAAATETIPSAMATTTMDGMDMTDSSMATTSTPLAEDSNGSSAPTSEAQGGATGGSSSSLTQIDATLREWALDLSQTEVPAGTVRFVVTNAGQHTHNLAVRDSNGRVGATPNFNSSEGQQILELELKPGTYSIICELPGHAARGQKNELVVK